MSTRRFFAFLALACWLVLTPIALWTGQQWSEQQIRYDLYSQETRSPADGPDPRAAEAFRVAEEMRQAFWKQVAAWIVVTITAAALLAEHKHHAERHLDHAVGHTPEHIAERHPTHASERA